MRDTTLLGGWLFADLLLALFVVFLAANTVGSKTLQMLTPVPSSTVAVVTPSPLPRLELHKNRLTLPIDPNGLLNNSPTAINALKQEVRSQSVLQGRTAGLVIAYGEAPDTSQIPTAQEISIKVMGVLQSLGQQGFVFTRTSYYDPLYVLYGDPNFTVIDVYLFAK